MIKFPSISQFRTTVATVRAHTRFDGRDENGKATFLDRALPTLTFRGTVKLHGTNSALTQCFDPNWGYRIGYQSRYRELSLTDDNMGFCAHMMRHSDVVLELFRRVGEVSRNPFAEKAIFGEWAGQGTVRGTATAVSTLPKFFSIFAIKIGGEWHDIEKYRDIEFPEARIFNNLRFGSWLVDVNFERPDEARNDFVDVTTGIEAECPAGKSFGAAGIGEGAVWTCVTPGWESSDYWFKVKGEKHSVTKVETLAAVDVEAVRAANDFVDATVTLARLEQGLHNLLHEQQKPLLMTSMADFIRWVYNDIMKEEADTILASQLDPKKLGSPIANKARPWFTQKVLQRAIEDV